MVWNFAFLPKLIFVWRRPDSPPTLPPPPPLARAVARAGHIPPVWGTQRQRRCSVPPAGGREGGLDLVVGVLDTLLWSEASPPWLMSRDSWPTVVVKGKACACQRQRPAAARPAVGETGEVRGVLVVRLVAGRRSRQPWRTGPREFPTTVGSPVEAIEDARDLTRRRSLAGETKPNQGSPLCPRRGAERGGGRVGGRNQTPGREPATTRQTRLPRGKQDPNSLRSPSRS